ncbi:MAG: SMP-30/gluconolactonase/LRE family protein [Cognatishimia sp.]
MGIEISCVAPVAATVGEGAVWDHRANLLWWVDIVKGVVFSYDPKSQQNRSYHFGEPVGCLAVREGGGLILAAKTGFWSFDPPTGTREHICDPESHLPFNQFNDGATDTKGRFWAGTMKGNLPAEAIGNLYRLDKDLKVTQWKGEFLTINGLAFSPDGLRMYFSDSHPDRRTIWACSYDADTGTPGEPEVFFRTQSVKGRPDGGTVDAEGCYWQAGVGGWQIYRISPQGQLLTTIDLPIEKPTKPMFGGPNLDTLFVTSIGGSTSNAKSQPLAGGLFAITGLGVAGVPQQRFSG